jgi:hypothetical protein
MVPAADLLYGICFTDEDGTYGFYFSSEKRLL